MGHRVHLQCRSISHTNITFSAARKTNPVHSSFDLNIWLQLLHIRGDGELDLSPEAVAVARPSDTSVGIGALLEAVVFFAEDLGYIHRFAWNPLPYIAPAWVIEALPGATVLNVVRAGRQVSHATPTRKPNISAIAVYGLWVLLLAWGNGDTTISNYYETPFAFSTAATLHPPRFITQRNQEQSARATCRLVYSRQNQRWRAG